MAATSPYLRRETASNALWLVVAGLLALAAASGVMLAHGGLEAFYVLLAAVAGIAVLFDFRIGAVLLVVLLPFNATSLFPRELLGITGLNPLNVLVLATGAAYVLRGGSVRQLAPAPLLWLFVVPILAAGFMGMQRVDDIAPVFFEGLFIFTSAFGYLMYFALKPLMIVATAMLIGAAVAHSQKPERFLIPVLIAIWVIALIMLGYIAISGVRLDYLAGPQARYFFDEIGLHANDLGRLFAVAYGLLLFIWWETKNPRLKTALFFTMGVATLAMVLSFSRGALFGFFVINALFLVWKFNARTLGFALLAAAVAAVVMPDYLWNRITMGFDTGDANAVSADRVEGIWLPLLPEVWKSPLWGNGLAALTWSTPMVLGAMNVVGHPHNAYLESMLDMGLIGTLLLLAYYWHVWRGFRRLGSNGFLSPEMRGLFQGASAALICFLVTGMSGSSLRPEPEFGFLWLAIGFMYGIFARKPGG